MSWDEYWEGGYEKAHATPTPTATPKFKKGDIVNLKSIKPSNVGNEIVRYDKDNDEYILCIVTCLSGKWEVSGTGEEYSLGRAYLDENYKKIGKIGETVFEKTTPKPTAIRIKIIYPGSWSGNYADLGSSKSVDGTGTETFTISNPEFVVSAVFQKEDDSDRTLTVEILKDGKVVESESTSASYGVVTVSYTCLAKMCHLHF